MIEGVIIFGILAGIFLFLYFKKGMMTAFLVTSVLVTFGIMLLPDYVIASFYIRLGGRWRLIIIDMTTLKILILISVAFVYLFWKDIKKSFSKKKEVIF